MSITSPPKKILDLPALLERLGDDMDLVKELLALYIEDCPRLISDIKTAVIIQDARNLDLHAHSLKGASANLGALRLQELSYQLELMGKNNTLAQAASVFGELETEFEKFKTLVQKDYPA